MLSPCAQQGCLVNCDKDWDKEHIIELMARGPYCSAKSKAAIKFLREETAEKIKGNYTKIIKWKDIKDKIPA